MKYYFILAAAGVGKRMGLNYPKQFLEYEGKPLFVRSLEIANLSKVTDIIIVTNAEYIKKVEEIVKEYNIKNIKKVVSGGKERQDSIYNALKEVEDLDSFLAVQDGVRPFLEESYLDDGYKILLENKELTGVAVGVKVKDTIKKVSEDGLILETPERKNLIAIQTPQIFRTRELIDAYKKAYEEKYIGTDDASLVEKAGGIVKVIEGSYNNIKVTTPEDLKFLK
ncbi:MAG: 2-C-methyl-D-erythritol 4-phosphate cytidylyltransferase [Fusobacteriia bacterium 4572_132]|nr:MAG: 2-C-methyl-D-erythritol 4-phosphate cytidylyltransferase [Fusobacteriia bacterium 4572_132]